MNGNESPDGDAPIREDWVFGAEGLWWNPTPLSLRI